MMIILLALVPSVLFVLLFYLLDPNRKPLKVIGKVAAWSLVAFVPTTIMVFLMRALHIDHWLPLDNSILLDFDHAFLRAAIPEEVGKLLALWLFVRKCGDYFRAPYDGILYGACIGAIFGGLENIYYLGIGFPVVVRLLFSMPGHVMFALILGYFFARIRLGESTWRNKVCMLLIPILFHGFWDFFLFMMRSDTFGTKGDILLMLFVLVLFVFGLVYCVRLTRASRKNSVITDNAI